MLLKFTNDPVLPVIIVAAAVTIVLILVFKYLGW